MTQADEAFSLSAEEVDSRFDEIVTATRRPKLARATAAWHALGDRYRSLGPRSST